ncbi:MAG TPA: 6-bladed beta-propeller, partial [Longimicrobiales bacterium]|nr:6-bladed beta-propeller [Longimicrobiales bacterium]
GIVLVLSAVCAACGHGGSEPETRAVATRTDSAGVEIVVSEVPPDGAPAFAEVDPGPALRLGSLDGPEEEQFGSIADVAPLADGGVAILDRQAAQVRLFDAEGAYLGALGSRGEGPGEFMSPSDLARLAGDTFAVYDARARRVTRYPADGGDPDVRTLRGGGRSAPLVVDFLPDGRVVGATRWSNPDRSVPKEGEDLFSQDSAVIGVYSAQGDFADTAAVIPDREVLVKIMRAGQAINVLMAPTAFARRGVFAAHPEGVWAGFGDRWEIRLHDASTGAVRRILRAPGLERALTEDEMDAVHQTAMAQDTTPAQRERTATWWDLSPRPEIRPTYDRALVDAGARLWLREWPGADEAHQRWWVFGEGGDLLGHVDAPEGVTFLAVSGDDAWGVLRDDFDVQYVVRYGLSATPP